MVAKVKQRLRTLLNLRRVHALDQLYVYPAEKNRLVYGQILRKFLSLLWFLSGCKLLLGNSLGSGSNGPDEAQQFTGNCRDDLPLVLAGCAQFHITLVQAVLRFPRNLFRFFRDALLSSAQSIPDSWWMMIAPGCFDNDSSQVRVAGFRDASTPDPQWLVPDELPVRACARSRADNPAA